MVSFPVETPGAASGTRNILALGASLRGLFAPMVGGYLLGNLLAGSFGSITQGSGKMRGSMDSLQGTLESLLDPLGNLALKGSDAFAEWPTWAQYLTLATTALIGLGPFLPPIISFFTAAPGLIGSASTALLTFATNPVTIMIGLAIGAGIALYLLATRFKFVRDWANYALGPVNELNKVLRGIQDFGNRISPNIPLPNGRSLELFDFLPIPKGNLGFSDESDFYATDGGLSPFEQSIVDAIKGVTGGDTTNNSGGNIIVQSPTSVQDAAIRTITDPTLRNSLYNGGP